MRTHLTVVPRSGRRRPRMPSRTSCPTSSRSRPRARSRSTVARLGDGRDHLLLRFDGSIHNIGPGPLEIRGSQPVNGAMTVTGQRIYRSDSQLPRRQQPSPADPLRELGRAPALAPEGRRPLLTLGRGRQRAGGPGVQGGLLPAGQRARRQLRPRRLCTRGAPPSTAGRDSRTRRRSSRGYPPGGWTTTRPTFRSSGWTSRTSRPGATGSPQTWIPTTSCSRGTRPTTAPRWPPRS